jgi:hypothetical protein
MVTLRWPVPSRWPLTTTMSFQPSGVVLVDPTMSATQMPCGWLPTTGCPSITADGHVKGGSKFGSGGPSRPRHGADIAALSIMAHELRLNMIAHRGPLRAGFFASLADLVSLLLKKV